MQRRRAVLKSTPHAIPLVVAYVGRVAVRRCGRGNRACRVSTTVDFTGREITSALFKAKPGERVDYSHHDLTYLDLGGLDFKCEDLVIFRSLRR